MTIKPSTSASSPAQLTCVAIDGKPALLYLASPHTRSLTPTHVVLRPSSQWCLETLLHKFGNSGLRMSRLLGLHCEYKQRWDEAAEHYAAILQADPTNIAAHKRTIALAKSRNNTEQAITLLTRYTKLFASDEAGWTELALLYCQQQAWELAAFCYEELLLLVPEQPLYHCRYAELLYAAGKYELARQYFAQSVELKPDNNLRALYGILMVTAAHTHVSASTGCPCRKTQQSLQRGG